MGPLAAGEQRPRAPGDPRPLGAGRPPGAHLSAAGRAVAGLARHRALEAERRWSDGHSEREARYYLLSTPLSAQRFGEAVRSHWGIQDQILWVLDMAFREDESRVREGPGRRELRGPAPPGAPPPQTRADRHVRHQGQTPQSGLEPRLLAHSPGRLKMRLPWPPSRPTTSGDHTLV